MADRDLSRYAKGKIYKIVSDNTDKIYIGSTCLTLSQRLSKHVNDYKRYLEGKMNNLSSFEIIKLSNYKIVLIEDYKCESKNQLEARERYWIETQKGLGNCVNKCVPSHSLTEWRAEHKNELDENKKGWYLKNKERILIKRKETYLNKKNMPNVLFDCECGITVKDSWKTKHFKTKKHINFIQAKQNAEQL